MQIRKAQNKDMGQSEKIGAYSIAVNIDNGMLFLSGVRKLETKGTATWEEFGNVKYVRSLSVPPTIDIGKVKAELKDGFLRLHLPKSESAKPKRIEIKTA